MLSVSYADKSVYSTGKTYRVLRGGASGTNRGYVLAHCTPPPKKNKILAILASWSFHQKPTAKVGLFQFKRYFPFKKKTGAKSSLSVFKIVLKQTSCPKMSKIEQGQSKNGQNHPY